MRSSVTFPQEFGLYPRVSAEDLLDHFALLKGIIARRARQEVVTALLRQTNLWEVRRQKLGGYSGGMMPADAGIDPYHLLLDLERFDNVERVKIER